MADSCDLKSVVEMTMRAESQSLLPKSLLILIRSEAVRHGDFEDCGTTNAGVIL
jgi:hypothetical protein